MDISFDRIGFTYGKSAVTWESIRGIAAYKRDLCVYDEICVLFKAVGDVHVEVSEEDAGFTELMAEMDRRYRGLPADWYTHVMQPAFATNYTVLWGQVEALPEPVPSRPTYWRWIAITAFIVTACALALS